MSRSEMVEFYRGSIGILESISLTHFRCWYFFSAYKCRKHLNECGFADAVVVSLGDGTFIPMDRAVYREWRRLRRELEKVIAQPEYI